MANPRLPTVIPPQGDSAAPQSVIVLRGRAVCTYEPSAFVNLHSLGFGDGALHDNGSSRVSERLARARNDAIIFTVLFAATFVLELFAFGAFG
jgi:hypothetical protein